MAAHSLRFNVLDVVLMKPCKCKNCNVELIEFGQEEAGYFDMSDGQKENYDAGYEHPFQCPKCKEIYLLEGEGTYGPDDEELDRGFEKKKMPAEFYKKLGKDWVKKQKISEDAAIKHYKKQGYLVAKIAKPHIEGKKTQMRQTPAAKRLFKKVGKVFIDFLGIGLREDLRTYLTTDLGAYGVPDLFCLKKKDVLFVEVKNSFHPSCKPTPQQIKKFNEISKSKIPIELFVYEGRNNKPDISVWTKQSPKLFKDKIKKKMSASDKKKSKVVILEKGQTILF